LSYFYNLSDKIIDLGLYINK